MGGDIQASIQVHLDVSEPDDLPVSYFFRSYDEMPLWERVALDSCRGRILDAGAGAGSHALELQSRGLEVVALDLSPGAVEIMKARGIKNAVCQDFFAYKDTNFDTILFLMNGAGMAASLEGLQRLFRRARKFLNPGGQILVESTDLIYLFEDEDGSYSIPIGAHYYGEVVYQLEYKGRKGKPFHWLFVDPDNLTDAAEKEGFLVEFLYLGEDHNYVAKLVVDNLNKDDSGL